MNMNNRISARALLAVASLTFSPAAWSLGLGDATVESYLNQPLKARIDLISQADDDLASISARLASAADYELIGASLEDISVPVRFSVENIDGDAYLLASSQLPMSDPIVRLIVEVNWSSGRMLREYTLFLDPPAIADQSAPLPRIDQRAKPPAQAVSAPPPPARVGPEISEPAAQAAEPARPAVQPAREPVGGEYGPVASGETLWGIARDWSAGTGMNINKVMIAIQRENPQAFMNNNINLLKRGAILRMPSANDVEQISRAAAYNEVAAQEVEFYERKGQTAPYSPTTPLLSEDSAADSYSYPDPEPEPVSEPGPEPVEAVVEESDAAEEAQEIDYAAAAESLVAEAPEEAEPLAEEGRLELLPPSEASELDSTYGFEESEESGDAALADQSLRENLARTEEDLIAEQQQNEYLQERIRELESQLEEAEKATVADSELADMEQRLREERVAQQSEDSDEPWYSRFGVWLLGLLVLAAAAAGLLLRRRTSDDADDETIRGIKDEAEDLLRVLDDSKEPAAATEPDEESKEPEAEAEEETDEDATRIAPTTRFGGSEDEADFLDAESSDPEIQLDLARAYISMGDKEAARVILEEVASNGSEEQQAEARNMLDLM